MEQDLTVRIGVINRQRIQWVLAILLIVHFAHIAMFWPYTAGATTERELWRNGVLIVHGLLILFVTLLLVGKRLLEHRSQPSWMLIILPELVALVYLLGGAALAVVDQRVTSSINPLVIAAIGVALVIVARPAAAVANYVIVLGFFLLAVPFTQPNTDLLLTIRVNSITSIGLGLGLALLQWRNQLQSLRQQHRIDEQQRELEQKNRELTLLATRDALTGLLNRAQFILDANREVIRMQRTGATACLVTLDIDHFKQINDTFGHPVGDTILTEIAAILNRKAEPNGLLARFGGEEFTLLLPGASVTDGLRVAEELRVAIVAQPFSVGGQALRVTASFGVAELRTESIDALDSCYRSADRALYHAKNEGRNCVRVA